MTWVTPGTLLRRYGRSSITRRCLFRGVRPEVFSVAHSCADLRRRGHFVFRRRGVARVCLSIRDIHGSYRSNVAWQRQQVGFRCRFGDAAFLVLYLLPSSPMGNLHCQHLLRLRLGNGRLPDLLTVPAIVRWGSGLAKSTLRSSVFSNRASSAKPGGWQLWGKTGSLRTLTWASAERRLQTFPSSPRKRESSPELAAASAAFTAATLHEMRGVKLRRSEWSGHELVSECVLACRMAPAVVQLAIGDHLA